MLVLKLISRLVIKLNKLFLPTLSPHADSVIKVSGKVGQHHQSFRKSRSTIIKLSRKVGQHSSKFQESRSTIIKVSGKVGQQSSKCQEK